MKNSEQQDIMFRIERVYNNLTKSEKKVADLVLSDAQQMMYETISDVAEKANVGDATVFRFCKRLGFKGFFAFRIALAQHALKIQSNPDTVNSKDLEISSTADMIQKTTKNSLRAIEKTSKILDEAAIDEVVNLISNKEKIYFFGLGNSNIAAIEAMNKFLRIGMNVIATTDTHLQLMAASLMSPNDLALGFSLSGSTKDMVNIMKTAKKTGASTVCITNHLRSPISQYSDIILLTNAHEGPYEGGSIEGRLSQSFVINVLFNGLMTCNPHIIEQARRKVIEVIEEEML